MRWGPYCQGVACGVGERMSIEKVTSLEVARRAGVSQSAVSRVFTPGASVSQKTIEKVRQAAAELGYRPNVLARSLITGKSRLIGLVVAHVDNHFYPTVIERLSVALQARGYHVLVFLASPETIDIDTAVQEILDYQADALILASVGLSPRLTAQCEALQIPVLAFSRGQDDPAVTSVTTDNLAGGRAIGRHLVRTGRRRIGYISGLETSSTQRDRETGFREALAEAGLSLGFRAVGAFDLDRTREVTREMFAGHNRPDALFVGNDHMAFAAMDVLRSELGLSVPGDVAVAGFDDVTLAAWPTYDLTSFRQPVDEMITETVAVLMDQLGGRYSAPNLIRLKGELIVRGSTRVPAAAAVSTG